MNDEAARQGRPDTNTITRRNDSNGDGAELTLSSLSFSRVEFTLEREGGARVVRVDVLSGPSRRGISFPSFDSETTRSTGCDELDEAIRRRAGEELVRLEAAARALRLTP